MRLACECGGRVFCRADSDLPTRCSFCQSTLTQSTPSPEGAFSATTSESDSLSTPPRPIRRRLFLAEIVCLLCGRHAGTAAAEHWPPHGPILFQPPEARVATVVRAWWRVRCTVCGGNRTANEVTTRTVRLEAPIDWRANPARRGRPPKWLVEQRRNAGHDAA